MTAQEIAYSCLAYLGEFSQTLVEYTSAAGAEVKRSIVRCINRSVQDVFELNPALFKREVGLTVAAPLTGTVGVTADSVNVTAPTFSGNPTLAGQSIQIAGQTEWNQIFTENAGVYRLVAPYTGTTATRTATLYGDAILLPTTYSKPLGPLWLGDIRELFPLAGKGDFISYDPRQDLSSDWGRYPFGQSRLQQGKLIAQPEGYFVDSWVGVQGTAHRLRIHLTPVPERQYQLRFDAGVRPDIITVANLGSEGTDPAVGFNMPAGYDEKFLLPVVLYHWQKTPFFKNAEARKEIKEDYTATVGQIETWRAQSDAGARIVTTGWR